MHIYRVVPQCRDVGTVNIEVQKKLLGLISGEARASDGCRFQNRIKIGLPIIKILNSRKKKQGINSEHYRELIPCSLLWSAG